MSTTPAQKRGRMKSSLPRVPPTLIRIGFFAALLPAAFCLLTACAALYCAQQPKPYAAIDHNEVDYHGPGRDHAHDLTGGEIRLGLLAPLTGPSQAEGADLRRAAEMAIEQENAARLPGARALRLIVRDESGPWGQASAQIVHMVFDDQAIAIITSASGAAAHMAEQVANKIGLPVLTLSADSTTTEINLPWIFRMGPSDTVQACAFARDIYETRKLKRVALVSADDHDGRTGSEEFTQAAREMNAPAPAQIVITPGLSSGTVAAQAIATALAVVIWADAATAEQITARVRQLRPGVLVYLSRRAADGHVTAICHSPAPTPSHADAGPWIAAPAENLKVAADFRRRYRQRFNAEPGTVAAEAYDAVRILAASLRQSGPNRARLRDALAGVSSFPGASGVVTFDHAGNDTSPVRLLKFK